ncbi:hypothetical protein SAMN05421823_109136 [Catalinimonas alkaloidigena]|uniref:Yip1 domain-containing protein n=1 Tax=Catalinimonas alkaloidigena TaxID=1075417 RepID=A0A1G9PAH2_9BACT|nr:hypothetical protein [Catalinimonas alkaloidigena]SDL95872.1 hypothetical protein SAMN05421823_109136 [Catalinimonas alkaloidigena]
MNVTAWLLNPFQKVAGEQALAWGSGVVVLGGLTAWWHQARFDGVLDMHLVEGGPWVGPFLDGVVNVLVLTIVFYPLGLLLNRGRVRLLDVVGTMALARAPFVLLPFLNSHDFLQRTSSEILTHVQQGTVAEIDNLDLTLLLLISVLSLGLLVWMVLWLYRAYAVSCNVRGAKGIISFIVGLVLAELLSKWLIGHWVQPYLSSL